jgi:LysM repeat protein
MNGNSNREEKDFLSDITDALGHEGNTERIRRRRKSPKFSLRWNALIIVGGVAVLVILVALFSIGVNRLSPEEQPSIQARLSQLEKRLTRQGEMGERVSFLEQREKVLSRLFADYDRSEGSLLQRVDTLSERVDRLEKKVTTVISKTGITTMRQRMLLSPSRSHYHKVKSGDTLYHIALQYDTSVEELCRLNKISSEQVIYPGQKLLVVKEDTE